MANQWQATYTASVSSTPTDEQDQAAHDALNGSCDYDDASGRWTLTWNLEAPSLTEAVNMALGQAAQTLGEGGVTSTAISLSVEGVGETTPAESNTADNAEPNASTTPETGDNTNAQ